MERRSYRVYGYRWVVLAVYSLLQFVCILLGYTFAPITGEAAAFYGVTPMKIGFLLFLDQQERSRYSASVSSLREVR